MNDDDQFNKCDVQYVVDEYNSSYGAGIYLMPCPICLFNNNVVDDAAQLASAIHDVQDNKSAVRIKRMTRNKIYIDNTANRKKA